MKTIKKGEIARICYLMLITGFVIIPVLGAVLGGFKSLGELRTNPFGLPSVWEFEHYAEILSSKRVWKLLFNSLVISFFSVFLTLLSGSMAAFAFAQIRFFGSKMLFNYLLMGMMFPVAAGILPLFIKVRDFGLLDTYAGVILPQVAFGLGFSVLLFKTFFEQLPKELFEAARMDGCGYVGYYWHFILPLSTPILATVGVFTLVSTWNNFMLPLIMINNTEIYPWTLGMMQYFGQYGAEWNKVLAYITVTISPALVFFLLAQKYIISGLTAGSVKG